MGNKTSVAALVGLCLSVVLVGCRPKQPADAALLAVEKAMNSDADSAFLLLCEYNETHLNTPADSALYALLYTEAIHRKGLRMQNDSFIAYADSFYSAQHDRRRMPVARLHHAVLEYHRGRWQQAVAQLKEAESMARRSDDSLLRCEVALWLGRVNADARCTGLARRYFREAYDWSKTLPNSDTQAQCLVQLLRSELKEGKVDSLNGLLVHAQRLLPIVSNRAKGELLALEGSVNLLQRDTAQATRLYRKALACYPTEQAQLPLANILAVQNRWKEATDLWFQVLNGDDDDLSEEAYGRLVDYYSPREEWRALHLSQLLNTLYRRRQTAVQAETVASWQQDYDAEAARKQWKRQLLVVVFCLIGLALGCLSFFLYHKKRVRKWRSVADEATLREQQRASDEAQAHAEQEQRLAELLIKNALLQRLHRQAAVGKALSADDKEALCQLVEQQLPLFMAFITRQEPLTERQILICMFTKLRFVPTEIGSLLGSSPQSVTNARVRLLSILFHQTGGARDFDNRIYAL